MNLTKRYVVEIDETDHRRYRILAGATGVCIRALVKEASKEYLDRELTRPEVISILSGRQMNRN